MYDVIIIGKGPAGISAALYTARSKLKTLIVGGTSYLSKSHKVDNYYGFPEGISGPELLNLGEQHAKKFGVDIKDDVVLSLDFENNAFKITTKEGKFESRTILLATGSSVNKVKIDNIDKFEGKGIHYCVVCDGFFYNTLKVGILGYTDYAVHEAMELKNFSNDVTIYLNGKDLEIAETNRKYIEHNNIKINYKKIKRFEGEEKLQNIVFEDETDEKIDGLFVAYGSASTADFARKLGILMNNNLINVDKNQMTNIPGIFAAGDCTSEFKQISVAVGQGAIAGQKIVEYIRNLEK